jgi:hypothetical protein
LLLYYYGLVKIKSEKTLENKTRNSVGLAIVFATGIMAKAGL